MGPNRSLLDRDMARAKAEQIMPEVVATTREIVDEGTQLLARLLAEAGRVSPPKRFHSALLMLLRHCIEQADAVDELLRAGIFAPAALQVRSVVEAYIQMLYMTGQRVEFVPSPLDPAAGDVDPVPRDASGAPLTGSALEAYKERRGATYIVADIRRMRDHTQGLTATRAQAWATRATGSSTLPAQVANPANQAGLAAELQRHQATLALPENQALDAAITTARGKQKFDPAWYSIDGGPRSVRALAGSVGAVALYDLFYSPASEVMHAQNIRGQLGPTRAGGGHGPAPLRSPSNIGPDVIRKLIIALAQVYRLVIAELRPTDVVQWNQWAQRWFDVVARVE
jgi:hypothetical protein